MKRKTMALLLALSMCLSLLSACGSGGTATGDQPPESENAASSTEQPGESEKPEESDELEEEDQEEPEPENNAGTEFLALLQEEWNNGFFEGEGPNHTYYFNSGIDRKAFIYNGVVYLPGVYSFRSYGIDSKEIHETVSFSENAETQGTPIHYFMDGNFYIVGYDYGSGPEARIYDCNGELLASLQYTRTFTSDFFFVFFEKGILAINSDTSNQSVILLSLDFEKIADIPAPQREIEHGLKKDFELKSGYMFAADGTVYTKVFDKGTPYLYRLNTDTYEWESLGEWNNDGTVFLESIFQAVTAFMTVSQESRFLNTGNCIALQIPKTACATLGAINTLDKTAMNTDG